MDIGVLLVRVPLIEHGRVRVEFPPCLPSGLRCGYGGKLRVFEGTFDALAEELAPERVSLVIVHDECVHYELA